MPVELNLDELKVSEPDADELRKIFTELEFKTLADKFLNKAENNKKAFKFNSIYSQKIRPTAKFFKNASLRALNELPHTYKLIDNEEEMKKICDFS